MRTALARYAPLRAGQMSGKGEGEGELVRRAKARVRVQGGECSASTSNASTVCSASTPSSSLTLASPSSSTGLQEDVLLRKLQSGSKSDSPPSQGRRGKFRMGASESEYLSLDGSSLAGRRRSRKWEDSIPCKPQSPILSLALNSTLSVPARYSSFDRPRKSFYSLRSLYTHAVSYEEGEEKEEKEQKVRRSWSKALATRRAQWGKSIAGGGASSRGSLPKDVFDVSFSRSQGPGGQNVNKVNTKANVRLLLAQAASPSIFDSGRSPLPVPIPREVVRRLVEKSSYYTHASHSLLVSSESLRTQEGNLSDAIEKLLDHLYHHATQDLINPTSPQQKAKVQKLIEKEKRKLKRVKSQRSAVKSGRRDKGF